MKENKMIKNISYELYKEDWKKAHGITLEIEKNNIKDYFANLEESKMIFLMNLAITENYTQVMKNSVKMNIKMKTI